MHIAHCTLHIAHKYYPSLMSCWICIKKLIDTIGVQVEWRPYVGSQLRLTRTSAISTFSCTLICSRLLIAWWKEEFWVGILNIFLLDIIPKFLRINYKLCISFIVCKIIDISKVGLNVCNSVYTIHSSSSSH